MKGDCVSCVYAVAGLSDEPDEGLLLKCHRYPPVQLVLDGDIVQSFPDAEEPCGEYKQETNNGDSESASDADGAG